MDLKVTFILGWDDFKPRRNTPNPFLNHSIVIAYFPCADYFNSLIILNKYYRKKKKFHNRPRKKFIFTFISKNLNGQGFFNYFCHVSWFEKYMKATIILRLYAF